jgi:hypothetical protein
MKCNYRACEDEAKLSVQTVRYNTTYNPMFYCQKHLREILPYFCEARLNILVVRTLKNEVSSGESK